MSMAFSQKSRPTPGSWGVAPGYGGSRPSAKHGRTAKCATSKAAVGPTVTEFAGRSERLHGVQTAAARVQSLFCDPVSVGAGADDRAVRPAQVFCPQERYHAQVA